MDCVISVLNWFGNGHSYAESFKIEPFFTGGRVQVASSGRWLLCQCGDAVHVVDAQLGRSVRGLVQPDDEFIAFAVAPDQMTLVSSHKSGLLRHWTWNGSTFQSIMDMGQLSFSFLDRSWTLFRSCRLPPSPQVPTVYRRT